MLEPPRPSAEAPYTPCYLCDGVVRVGSMRFDVLEPPRSTAIIYTRVTGEMKVRGGSSTSNLIEPTRTTPSQR